MSDKTVSAGRPSQVQTFLDQLGKLPRVTGKGRTGRLLFALDATASREPTWRTACELQQEMFDVAAALGGLEIQLCYYRGLDEFHAGHWNSEAGTLRREMAAVACLGGYTQIARVLRHAREESRTQKVDALVFVGDCMEEDVDALCRLAGELGLSGIRAFVFQEGSDPGAERAFRQIAKLSQGAYCRFDQNSARQLRELLGAVAAYAAGGLQALEQYGRERKGAALQITRQIQQP